MNEVLSTHCVASTVLMSYTPISTRILFAMNVTKRTAWKM
jgi:hypothetical protein